jgi:hypothetical protein
MTLLSNLEGFFLGKGWDEHYFPISTVKDKPLKLPD